MSTYTSSLRLTLPVTGEYTNTWGSVVNDGVTSLVDASIAGYAAITMTDANYTLVTVNGATDEARKMMLNISGTLSAARNVICPTASKLYFVKNSTTGGFAITLKTSAGTGVSVPNGKSMVLLCDGTNVVTAVNYLSALDAATIGATTPGTGAFTTLSASSTVSGAGFSTYLASPPAIGSGTPSTGAFTTLSASSTVSGAGFSTYLASPPAIGSGTPGTGAFTTLSATNFSYTGTLTGGTGVVNLGSGQVYKDASGNVGIGTAVPGALLDVKGTIRLSGSASGYVGFTPAATAGSTTYTLPTADGTAGQVLITNGAGVLSWAASVTPGTANVGYLNIPQNSQSTAYTLVLADAGKHILHPSADTTARVFTIPANSSVAYPIGTAITFVNQNGAGAITIAITTDTMRLAGPGTTGSRTLAANGTATALKIASTEWIISGVNLS